MQINNEYLKIFKVSFSVIIILIIAYFYQDFKKKHKKLPYFSYNQEKDELIQTSIPSAKTSEFSFINQLGETFTQKNTENKIIIADYFYATCPGICKEMSSEMKRIYKKFEYENSVQILSYTSKPEEDSAKALLEYANRHGVKDHSKWVFLTGNKKELYEVARKQYFIVNDKGDGGDDDFIHTERFVLVDKNKFIRGYYDGTDSSSVSKLIIDIENLLKQ